MIVDITNGALPDSVHGLRKVESLRQLADLDLPTPKGIVLLDGNPMTVKEAQSWLTKAGWPRFLVRTDHARETANAPAGGYLHATSDLPALAKRIIQDGRVLICLEPHDKHDNLYGINVALDASQGQVIVEAVGAGFDVSDINRQGMFHEIRAFEMDDAGGIGRQLSRVIVTQADYERSATQRLIKIANDLVARGALPAVPFGDEAAAGRAWLQQHGYRRLLDAKAYKPLDSLVDQIRDDMDGLGSIIAAQHQSKVACISASVFPEDPDEVLYWDVVDPPRKYAKY